MLPLPHDQLRACHLRQLHVVEADELQRRSVAQFRPCWRAAPALASLTGRGTRCLFIYCIGEKPSGAMKVAATPGLVTAGESMSFW